jgi:hypothetical protein
LTALQLLPTGGLYICGGIPCRDIVIDVIKKMLSPGLWVPLSTNQITINNGGGGEYGAFAGADINQTQTLPSSPRGTI